MEPTPRPQSAWRRLALAAVVAGSAALALVWVFLVPIYQAPDEPMNFDYALAIHAHGGLFWVHGTSFDELPRTVHPYTDYLVERCRNSAVAFHPTEKMPHGYGTWNYFVALDREGPPTDSLAITTPNKPFAVYPFGYYGLVALWVEGLSLIHQGPVFVFFGARILSVLLLIGTLLLIDATLRRLHFRPWPALRMTACIGFFPLTTFVASAIQGDNLSFFLVTLAFYLALRIREAPGRLGLHALLGLTLGALVVTKIHFFACVAVPVFAMIATEASESRMPWLRRTLAAAWLLVPALLMGGLYVWTTWGTTNLYYPPVNEKDALAHAVHMAKEAFLDFYAGTTHDSFWGCFGWLDTPLIISSRRTNQSIQTIVQFFGWLLLALTLLRLEQVTSRLIHVARSGRKWTAWRMVVSDPLVNSYFLFTLFMFVLYVRIDNRFGAQGRNWLPLLLPIFLVAICYAPKALTLRPSRVIVSRMVLGGLLIYCALGSYYAIPTLVKRYYTPSRHAATQLAEETATTEDDAG